MMELLPQGHMFAGMPKKAARVIMLDPATKFSGGTKGRPQHYRRMTHEQIARLPLIDMAHPEGCWVACWINSPQFRNCFRYNEGWINRKTGERIPGWGAEFSGRAFVWLKTLKSLGKAAIKPMFMSETDFHMGQGYTTRKNAEDVWLFKFGKPKRKSKSIREPIFDPLRQHSRKPDEAYRRMEQYSDGPYVELFSREDRKGWFVWGDQAGLFNDRAAA